MAYRSKLEERVAGALDDGWKYEPGSYAYLVPRRYTPDFVMHIGTTHSHDEEAWIEVKGFFRVGDTAKYKAIRKAYPDNRLIMCLQNPNAKVRKGAKLTMAQWCEKEGWEWTTPADIEEEGL